MNIKCNGKEVTVTPAMKEAIVNKLSFLDKFIKDDTIRVTVVNEKNNLSIICVFLYNHKTIKMQETDTDFYEAIDKLADRLKNHISKLHSQKKKRKEQQHNIANKYGDELSSLKIAKRKAASVISLTEEQAIAECEMEGYNSYIFANKDDYNKVSMLYLRNDGDYGIVVLK